MSLRIPPHTSLAAKAAVRRVLQLAILVCGIVVVATAPAGAHPFNVGAHHGDDALSLWLLGAISAGMTAAALGLVWLRTTGRARRPMLRLALGAGALAIVLAACGSTADSGDRSDASAESADVSLVSILPQASGFDGPRPEDSYAEDLSAVAAIAGEATGLPDLITDAPVPREVQDIDFAGHRIRVARFDGYVTNQGPGILDMFGDPTLSVPGDLTSHSVWQRVWNGVEWEKVQQPPVRFESADGHNHFHLMEIARYSMWDGDKQAQVAPGEKVGFCLFDSEQFRQNSLPAYLIQDGYFCRQGAPLARVLRMGISPGWRDLYAWDLALQWVDASNVIPGEYYVAAESDPFDQVLEVDETNNGIEFSEEPMVIPGYNALPSVVHPTSGDEVAIDLGYETIGEPVNQVAVIVTSLPQHGELRIDGAAVEAGVTYEATSFVYVPDTADMADRFEFEAIEIDQEFPLFPQRALVMIAGQDARSALAVGGQRQTIYAGTSIQLGTSDPASDDLEVAWSVGGSGTIDNSGRYAAAAPADLASAEVVAITAAWGDVETTVEVEVVPPPNRLPHIEDPLKFVETGIHNGPVGGPTVERLVVEEVEMGVAQAFMVPVLDADGEAVTVRAEGMPPGLTIDATTAVVGGIATEPGDYEVTVYGDDGIGENSHSFTLTVTQ